MEEERKSKYEGGIFIRFYFILFVRLFIYLFVGGISFRRSRLLKCLVLQWYEIEKNFRV